MSKRDTILPADARLFYQLGAARPSANYQYAGCAETGDTTINLGEREAIFCKSDSQRGKFSVIGQKYALPELHDTSVRVYMPPASATFLARQAQTGCLANYQQVIGKCNHPQEFNSDWQSKILFENASLGSLGIPGMDSIANESTDPIIQEGSFKFEAMYNIYRMRFAERLDDEVLAEVVDGTYCGVVSCGDCGPYSEGCDRLYLITKANAGSPGLSGQLVYSNDGGVTGTAIDIPTLGGLDPDAIACVGNFLIVISEAARNLQYIQIARTMTASGWTEVTDGFVAAHGPRAIFAPSPGEVYFAGAAGYLYRSYNYRQGVDVIEAGVLTTENFNAIHGDGGDIIVAVGDNNTLIASDNTAETFSLIDGPQAGADLQSVLVMSDQIWIVGGDGGAFYYTEYGIETVAADWQAITFAGSGSGAIIHDIRASKTNSILYAAVEMSGRGYALRSTDGGVYWARSDSTEFAGLGDNDRVVFVAPCPSDVNVVAVGGLAADGSDGFVAVAEGG